MPDAPRLALTLVLATGQRLGEMLDMAPEDLELMDGTWIIPADKAKNGYSHTVPLTGWALKIVEEARRLHPDSDRVFPVSADTVRTYMRQAVQAAKLPRTVPHDIRRSVATHLGRLGHNRQVQDKILNHVDRSVGAIYEQYTYDREKRAALEDWAAEFERITSEATTCKD
jgi:integrase